MDLPHQSEWPQWAIIVRPSTREQAHVEAILAPLSINELTEAMEIMAVHVAVQTVSHVVRPALGGRNVIAQPRLCFRLQPIRNRLRHADACQELPKQARWPGRWGGRGFVGRLAELSENSAAPAGRRGRSCRGGGAFAPTVIRLGVRRRALHTHA